MPFYVMPHGIQVEVVHTLFESVCECVFTFLPRPFVGEPTLESASLAVYQYWTQSVLPRLSHQLSFYKVRAVDISDFNGQSAEVVLPEPILGGMITPSCTASVAVRVNLRVVNPPGGAKGCFFLPGIPTNQVAGNTLAPSWVADMNDHVSDLIDLAEANNWRWVVPHKVVLPGRGSPTIREGWRVDFVAIESAWVGQRRHRLRNQLNP